MCIKFAHASFTTALAIRVLPWPRDSKSKISAFKFILNSFKYKLENVIYLEYFKKKF
jgi:hypothetical protein